MKLTALKEFQTNVGATLEDVKHYLSTELGSALRELRSGLGKLTFADNFESFEAELMIEPLTEQAVRNQMRTFTPSKRVIVRSNEAGLSVCDGDTPWSGDYLYLKNTHPTDIAVITVVFFR